MPKKKQTRAKASIEDIYCNKVFIPPKEQNLETIFEEPRQSKDGAPILTSVKKYKRYLHFDPTQNKIQKRKKQAKKCLKKLKTNYRITRSSPENSKSDDISMYILNVLGDSDSDIESNPNGKTKTFFNSDQSSTHATSSFSDVSCSNIYDTPKRNSERPRSCQLQTEDKNLVSTIDVRSENPDAESTVNTSYESQMSSTVNEEEALESSRRSPEKSVEILAH